MDTYCIKKAKGAFSEDSKAPPSEETWGELLRLVAAETPQSELGSQKEQIDGIRNEARLAKLS